MGLYMNKTTHPDIFMNQNGLDEPNQHYFKYDYVAEMVQAQKLINESLANAYKELETLQQKQQQTQAEEWKEVGTELAKLKESSRQHAQFEQQVMEGLRVLEENNEKLHQQLEQEGLLRQNIMDELSHIRESNQTVIHQIGDHESWNQEMTAKMTDLLKQQQIMTEEIANQRDDQYKTRESLENQDALLQKTLRQLTDLRSALFERSSYLAEKVEDSYQLTSAFMYHMFSESGQPLAFRLDQKMAEQEQNES